MTRLSPFLLLLLALAARADDPAPEEGFSSLFNGKDLAGWTYRGSKESLDGKTQSPDERIAVEDGVILMRAKDKDGKGGVKAIDTVKSYPDGFTLRLEFKAAPKADSGVYVRGVQLQVRDFIRRNEQMHLKKTFENDGWNKLEVVVKNGVTAAVVNGKALSDEARFVATFEDGRLTSATLDGKPVEPKSVQVRKGAVAYCSCNGVPFETMVNVPDDGRIGLQAEDGKFEFRRVRVKAGK